MRIFPQGNSDARKILISYNDPDPIQLARIGLESKDYAIFISNDRKQTIAFVKSEQSDLKILDPMKKNVICIEVARQMRADPDN